MNTVNVKQLVERIIGLSQARKRVLIALAGAPASGKSTLAQALVRHVNSSLGLDSAVVLPMDGYHYDNAVIEPMGLLPRKGSPETFDASGFTHLLKRLQEKQGAELEESVAIPVFDRDLDLARAGAVQVTRGHSIIVAEGNYLLLKRDPWQAMASCFDLTVMLQVPKEILEQRLTERWLTHGHSEEQALVRAQSNDLPNAITVITESSSADVVLNHPVALS